MARRKKPAISTTPPAAPQRPLDEGERGWVSFLFREALQQWKEEQAEEQRKKERAA